MSEQFEQDGSLVVPQVETDVLVLIRKIQQQLLFLEKKIDTLISQSQERPSRERSFSKPYRSFGHTQRYDRGERDSRPRDRGFSPRSSFNKHNSDEGRPQERSFNKYHSDENHSSERSFHKHHSDEKRGFSPRSKPFFRGKRERS
jgi:hypothetical protein